LAYARSKTEIENLEKEILNDIEVKLNDIRIQKGDKLAAFKRDAIHDVDVKRNDASLDDNDLDEVNRG